MSLVRIYNQSGALLAVLDSADGVGYELKHNELSVASFSLPTCDPRNALCVAHNYVDIEDGPRKLGRYRLIGMPSSEDDAWTEYELEHVMATLVDDVLFGQHEVGGAGVYTEDVLDYILAQQSTSRWHRGVCDFRDQFAYHFENCTLLAALYSVANVLVDAYTWDFDTSMTPWTVNLRAADATPGCGIHYMRSLHQITKTWDALGYVTRLYLLGYGEGVNQLTIKKVNGGLPYIDADNIDPVNPKCGVFIDTTIQDETTLLKRGCALLEQYKLPYATYAATTADLYALTGHAWDNYMPGKLVTVEDGEHGHRFASRIIALRKENARGRPQEIEVTIANAQRDTADSLNQLADRIGINEMYSQGATSLYVFNYTDNCTPSKPATFSIPIPASAYRVNVVKFLLKREAYRAYEQGAAAGGGSVNTTSSGGGGATTSESNGETTITEPQKIFAATAVMTGPIDSYGDSMTLTDGNFNNQGTAADAASGRTGASGDLNAEGSGSLTTNGASVGITGDSGYHSHYYSGSDSDDLTNHAHWPGGSVSTGQVKSGDAVANITISGNTNGDGSHVHAMGHTHLVPSHSHTLNGHTHSIGVHQHGMNHKHGISVGITIPEMTLTVSGHRHTVNVPAHDHSLMLNDHTHKLIYDIYEGTTASSFALSVDGVGGMPITEAKSEVDITALLERDADGRIKRDTWHEVQLTPDRATRAVVCVYVQCFVQSKGGGDF
ncbi:MAG: phage tail spike protein [Clostridia bacterium]